jgi:predicted metal-dependent phosphoesterase TrpH
METKVDLHVHTTCSDGAHSTSEVVGMLYQQGVRTFSITDHDTVDAIPDALREATGRGMTCIPGIELSTRHANSDVHMLGYFFDYTSPVLQEYVDRTCVKRIERAEKIVRKLNGLGVGITMSDVMKRASGMVVARPHIAGALIDRGYVGTYARAFQVYLSDAGPAFAPIDTVTVREGVELLHALGGLAVVAHPAILPEEVLREAIDAGVDGIEVVHPSNTAAREELYRSIASEFFLVQTGGSDFHGGSRNDGANLGRYFVSEEYIEKMKSVLQYRASAQ